MRNGKRKERAVNNAALEGFRMIAAAMVGPEPQNWQWIGQYMSQRHFGISEAKAKALAARHGGVASPMKPVAYEIGYEAIVNAAKKGGER